MALVEYLNSEFCELRKIKLSTSEAYSDMVHRNPYQADTCTEIRKQSVSSDSGIEPSTDSSSNAGSIPLPVPLRDISSIREHDEFVRLVINAKTLAQVENRPADIDWRGYSLTVQPSFDITRDNLKKELLSALKTMIKLNDLEIKV